MATSTAQIDPRAAAAWPPRPPSGENPETYRLESVERVLRKTSYFSLFSVPNPNLETVGIMAKLPPPLSVLTEVPFIKNFLLAGMNVKEAPHRYVTSVEWGPNNRMVAVNRVGAAVATVSIRWRPIPWDYPANPEIKEPPQTILSPFKSQRFEMLDGQFRFDDGHGTGFHGFGAGRTFPVVSLSDLHLRIGAVINILEGFGELKGFTGNIVVNGRITPPKQLNINLMVRVFDPTGKFMTQDSLTPLKHEPDPDPTATFMMFVGEPDPDRPSILKSSPDGVNMSLDLHERLRLIDIDFNLEPKVGLRSRVESGPFVGTLSSTLHLTASPDPAAPLAVQTTNGVFRFHDPSGREVGTVEADLIEGRGFPTPVDDAPTPLLRIGGFGPMKGGTGEFHGRRRLGLGQRRPQPLPAGVFQPPRASVQRPGPEAACQTEGSLVVTGPELKPEELVDRAEAAMPDQGSSEYEQRRTKVLEKIQSASADKLPAELAEVLTNFVKAKSRRAELARQQHAEEQAELARAWAEGSEPAAEPVGQQPEVDLLNRPTDEM